MRHDNADLQGVVTSDQFKPRTLLQTVIVASPAGSVVLDLPATPWTRFTIEVDDWASELDQKQGRMYFAIDGSLRSGANDYSWHAAGMPGDAGMGSDTDNTSEYIQLTRNDAGWQFGNISNESYSFSITIDPGAGSTHLPKTWWTGSGRSDTARLVGYTGAGLYSGTTSLVYGRVEQVSLSMSSGSIDRGTFRLYGTE